MNIGEALEAMKLGMRVHRRGWNGKGMWLRYVDLYNDEEFVLRETASAVGTWLPFIVQKTTDNGLVPWLCSPLDMLATDWEIVE